MNKPIPLDTDMNMCTNNAELFNFLKWASQNNDPFINAVIENLARYPVCIRTFVTGKEYLGMTGVYPSILTALEEMYHPYVDGLDHGLRIGTTYREVVLTGSLGSGKTYASVLAILYAIYLLSCLRNPHKLFGLDDASEIVFLFQSIRFQTGGVAYKLARELINGSKFFTQHYPRDQKVKNEILLPNNIVIRPVSGEVTAAIGMNIATVLLDEMSFMKYHTKSVNAEDGGEYDQAQALYVSARTRIDSRFSKYGRHIAPMFLAGSARHENDFIQAKIKEHNQQLTTCGDSSIYVYNKTAWQVKPWDYSGQTFKVYLGNEQIPPQVLTEGHDLYHSEHIVNVPVELHSAFTTQNISRALRDHCGIPSMETGSFIVEIEKAKSIFSCKNIFVNASCTFIDNDLPKLRANELSNANCERVWFCHLDLSRTQDSTGLALGFVDHWENHKPCIKIEGLLEIPPKEGSVIPWDAIIYFIFRLSKHIPLYCVSADQIGYNYLREQLVPYGYKIAKISDSPNSPMYHSFIDLIAEKRIAVASHKKTLEELLALNVDEKTRKILKPAGGSKDCTDALVSLIYLLRMLPKLKHLPDNWIPPNPPKLKQLPSGRYQIESTKNSSPIN